MRKERKHSFPKYYTTAGACYRARKNFEQRFPNFHFVITKLPEGHYMLICPNLQEQQEVVMETETNEIV